jgi:hypothetical protein
MHSMCFSASVSFRSHSGSTFNADKRELTIKTTGKAYPNVRKVGRKSHGEAMVRNGIEETAACVASNRAASSSLAPYLHPTVPTAALARFDLTPEHYFVARNIDVPIHYVAIVLPSAVRDYILLSSDLPIPLLDKETREASLAMALSLCILTKIAIQAHVEWLHRFPHIPVTAHIVKRMADWESWLVHYGVQPFAAWGAEQRQVIQRRAMDPPSDQAYREDLHMLHMPARFPAELAHVFGMPLPADSMSCETCLAVGNSYLFSSCLPQ